MENIPLHLRQFSLSFQGGQPLDTLDGHHYTDYGSLVHFRIGNPFKGESLIKTNKSEKADLEAARIAAEKAKADQAAALAQQKTQAASDAALAAAATEKAKEDNKTTIVVIISVVVAALAGLGLWFYFKKKGG